MPVALANPAETARHKIARRLLPFLFLLYATAFVDRVNVGFAGLDMTRELHFSNEVFGFGAGIFFFGLCLSEIPGAIVAHSWSVRKWIGLIMIAWGILAAMTGLIWTGLEFNIVRFLLGVAEGGFFPAVIVYLTHWFPQADRGKAVALFMTAIPISSIAGGLIAGVLLRLHWFGVPGWRWLLILEGLPAVVCGVATLFYLTDRPVDARWLNGEEKTWIAGELERENNARVKEFGDIGLLQALTNRSVLLLVSAYFFINLLAYGLIIWLPKMVQTLPGLNLWQVSMIASIPHVCAVPAMLVAGWIADRSGQHKWQAVGAVVVGAAGLAMSQLHGVSPTWMVAGFCIGEMGLMSFYPGFWALPGKLLSPRAAAVATGLITLANIGGFVGPSAIGFLTDRTGTHAAGVLVLAASALLAGGSVACLRRG